MTLDPANLTPVASLNRLRFTALSGLPIPARMIDWAAYALLSARALADLTARSDSADDAAQRYGERLGWLLVTLRLGDPVSRAARPDWDKSYWRHWAGVTTVYLGGGIVSGQIGQQIAEQAARTLAGAGMSECRVLVAPWPEQLPLTGAARSVPDAPAAAAVFDFGQSFVKQAVARYRDGTVMDLVLLPRQRATLPEFPPGTEPTVEQTRVLADSIVEVMAETWRPVRSVEPDVSSTIVASIACYLHDGQPMVRRGDAYAYLLDLTDNVADWLSERVSEATGQPLTIRLLHDGTAAATALAGEPHAAVIMLGTALGVGFPPSSDSGRPLAPDFTAR
jgi:hypothetical protein